MILMLVLKNWDFQLSSSLPQEVPAIGMSKANSRDELLKALQVALEYRCGCLCWKLGTGKEYTGCGIKCMMALPVIRLETPNAFMIMKQNTTRTTTQYHCPAAWIRNRSCLWETWRKRPVMWWRKGMGKSRRIYWWFRAVSIDWNQHCSGMTDHSLVPMAAKQAGINFDELVWRVFGNQSRVMSNAGTKTLVIGLLLTGLVGIVGMKPWRRGNSVVTYQKRVFTH